MVTAFSQAGHLAVCLVNGGHLTWVLAYNFHIDSRTQTLLSLFYRHGP